MFSTRRRNHRRLGAELGRAAPSPLGSGIVGVYVDLRCLGRQAGPWAVSLAWAKANSFWCGCAEAMAILIRRTDRRTWATIFSRARRSVTQVALANWVWARPM